VAPHDMRFPPSFAPTRTHARTHACTHYLYLYPYPYLYLPFTLEATRSRSPFGLRFIYFIFVKHALCALPFFSFCVCFLWHSRLQRGIVHACAPAHTYLHVVSLRRRSSIDQTIYSIERVQSRGPVLVVQWSLPL